MLINQLSLHRIAILIYNSVYYQCNPIIALAVYCSRHPNDPAIPGAIHASPLGTLALQTTSSLARKKTMTGSGTGTSDVELGKSEQEDKQNGTEAEESLSVSDDALVSKALEDAGFGRYQWRLFWLCGLGWANDSWVIL